LPVPPRRPALAACQKAEEKKPAGPPPALITVTQAKAGAMEVVEETLGTLEAVADPKIGAEVAGKVVQVLAGTGKAVSQGRAAGADRRPTSPSSNRADEAERKRAEALLAQQERVVERQQRAGAEGLHLAERRRRCPRPARRAARAAGGEPAPAATSPAAARARRASSRPSMAWWKPDRLGRRLRQGRRPAVPVRLQRKLRAHLPFPESAAPRLKKGQPVVLGSPLLPGKRSAPPSATSSPACPRPAAPRRHRRHRNQDGLRPAAR
jgi:membrane fusion protein (multidrug efflux system)